MSTSRPGASHSFQAAHEVEFAEQPGQGHARPDQTVCVRECDVWTVVARLYRNTAVSCFGCALVSASEDSVHVSIVASGYDKKPPKRRHCLQQPLSDRRLLDVGLRREILEIFIVVVSLADLFRPGQVSARPVTSSRRSPAWKRSSMPTP